MAAKAGGNFFEKWTDNGEGVKLDLWPGGGREDTRASTTKRTFSRCAR